VDINWNLLRTSLGLQNTTHLTVKFSPSVKVLLTYNINCVEKKRMLSQREKIIKQQVNKAIIELWPSSNFDKKKARAQDYSLIDKCAFWFKALRPVFKVTVNKWLNEKESQPSKGNKKKVCQL
jgi:hypothetical protein